MPPHNLPSLPTPFIGRRTADRIEALLADSACRLLTLLGPGGTGKTRLALEVARRAAEQDANTAFPDGVYFVSLAAIHETEYLISTVAQAVGFNFFEQKDTRQQLINYLSDRAMLLVMDNFEHLLEGAPFISEMLAAAPALKVLATSRERLNLHEEWGLEVGGMRIPDGLITPQDADQYSAVQMFLQGARRAKPDFYLTPENIPPIIRICKAVEGMPLAIELAASWIRTLTPDAIADELVRSLDILETPARNVPERHRSMRAMMQHTWALLTPQERDTFKTMSIFRAGFTREAAADVSGASLRMLQALVDKSLLKRDIDGRYRIHELVRQFAAEQLEADPPALESAQEKHTDHYLDFMVQQWPALTSSDQLEAIIIIRRELENVRAAWMHAAKRRQILRLQSAIAPLWYFHLITYRYEDGRQIFAAADKDLKACKLGDERERHAYALFYGRYATFMMNNELEMQMLNEALALLSTTPHAPRDRVDLIVSNIHAYAGVSTMMLDRCMPGWASDILSKAEEAAVLSSAEGTVWERAQVMYALALVHSVRHDLVKAREIGERALALAEETGDLSLIGNIAGPFLGQLAEFVGDYDAVRRLRHRSNEVLEHSGYWMEISWNYQGLGYAAYLQGDYAEARRYYRMSLRLYLQAYKGDPRRLEQINQGLINVAKIWAVEGRLSDAVALLATIEADKNTYGSMREWAGAALHYVKRSMSGAALQAALNRRGEYDLEAVAQAFVDNTDTPEAPPASPEPRIAIPYGSHLTERERAILRLIGEGKSNKEIAEAMVYSVGTVKWYVNQILSKLQVANRTQAVVRAQELKLI